MKQAERELAEINEYSRNSSPRPTKQILEALQASAQAHLPTLQQTSEALCRCTAPERRHLIEEEVTRMENQLTDSLRQLQSSVELQESQQAHLTSLEKRADALSKWASEKHALKLNTEPTAKQRAQRADLMQQQLVEKKEQLELIKQEAQKINLQGKHYLNLIIPIQLK